MYQAYTNPYFYEGHDGNYRVVYQRPTPSSWHGSAVGAANATVHGYEGRTQFDAYTEMEVIATGKETAAAVGDAPYVIYTELREFPVRMVRRTGPLRPGWALTSVLPSATTCHTDG